MKLVTLAIVFGSGAAFSPSKPIASAGRCQRGPSQIESTAEAADSKSAVEEISSYDKIGFAEDKIAIGINPDDVAEWIGGYVTWWRGRVSDRARPRQNIALLHNECIYPALSLVSIVVQT